MPFAPLRQNQTLVSDRAFKQNSNLIYDKEHEGNGLNIFLYEKLTHKLNQACSFMLLVKYIILQLLISSILIQYLVLLEPGIKIFQKPSSAKDFLIAHFCLIRSLTT